MTRVGQIPPITANPIPGICGMGFVGFVGLPGLVGLSLINLKYDIFLKKKVQYWYIYQSTIEET